VFLGGLFQAKGFPLGKESHRESLCGYNLLSFLATKTRKYEEAPNSSCFLVAYSEGIPSGEPLWLYLLSFLATKLQGNKEILLLVELKKFL